MRHIQQQTRDIVKEVAAEMGLSFEVVEDVLFHQFEFLRDCMEKGDKENFDTYENVLLKHLGTFYASERVIYAINESKNKHRESSCDCGEDEESDYSEDESCETGEIEET